MRPLILHQKVAPYTTELELILNFDYTVVINVPSPIDLYRTSVNR